MSKSNHSTKKGKSLQQKQPQQNINPQHKKPLSLNKKMYIVAILTLVVTCIGVVANFLPKSNSSPNSVTQPSSAEKLIIIQPSSTEKPLDLSYSNSLYSQGQELFQQALYEDALSTFDKALNYHDSHFVSDIDTAKIYCAKGLVHRCLGQCPEAIQLYTKALGIINSLSDTSKNTQHELGYIYYLRAIAYHRNDQFQRALADIDKSMELLNQIDINDDTKILYSKSSLYCLSGRIKYASAINEYVFEDEHSEKLGFTYKDSYYDFCTALDFKGLSCPQKQDGIWINNWNHAIKENATPGVMSYDEKRQFTDLNTKAGHYKIDKPDRETAEILIFRSYVLNLFSFYDDVIADCTASLEIYEMFSPIITDQVREACKLKADATIKKGYIENDNKPDLESVTKAYDIMNKGLEWAKCWTGNSYETANAYDNISFYQYLLDQPHEALQSLKKAKAICDQLHIDTWDIDQSIDILNRSINNEIKLEYDYLTGAISII